MRPVYETAGDLTAEDRVSNSLAEAWGFDLEKLPRLHTFDRALKRDGVLRGYVEIKNRKKSYPTYLISLRKWRDMLMVSETAKVPAALVVCWPVEGEMKTKVIRISNAKVGIVEGGRRDRDDPNDIEDMVEIPMSQFDDVF
jgi:hypothetical protein